MVSTESEPIGETWGEAPSVGYCQSTATSEIVKRAVLVRRVSCDLFYLCCPGVKPLVTGQSPLKLVAF